MGPLNDVTVIEMGGIGPSPFAAMMLADMGANVIRIDRQAGANANPFEVTLRGRTSIAVNLKDTRGIALLKRLLQKADILIEGFRPGVMEKLGLGPEVCWQENPTLVYGRMTGWGQTGPLSQIAGHDINYVAITGALASIGRAQGGPVPPLNLVGDFGGGAMYLVSGVLAALHQAKQSGQGQVVDAAISDGVISLMAMMQGYQAMGMWEEKRQNNIFDGGAPFYDTYECADGKWVAVGAIELHFYEMLITTLGVEGKLPKAEYAAQFDKNQWQTVRDVLAARFKEKPREAWCELFAGKDACFAPVLEMSEAINYPHNKQRESFIEVDGVTQAAPAPRFSHNNSKVKHGPKASGVDNQQVCLDLGFSQEEINELIAAGVLLNG